MKTQLLTFILSCFSFHLISQENKFTASLEYSPAFSKSTNSPYYPDNGFRLTHNIFLKAGYILNEKISFSSGLGYMNTAAFTSRVIEGFPEISRIDKTEYYHYLVVPVGIRFNFASFYVNPEIGVGYNFRTSSVQFNYLSSQEVTKTKNVTHDFFFKQEKIYIPIFFSFGNEIDISGIKIILGVKGYYSLTPTRMLPYWPRKAYGIGVVTGLRF